jgi:hypothetical protein
MPPKTTATLTAKEEKEIITLPIFNGLDGLDYTSWQNAMSAYLEFKQLWSVVEKDISDGAKSKLVTNQLEAWLILNSKIAPEIFTSLTSVHGRNPHKIWMKLKTNYATATIYGQDVNGLGSGQKSVPKPDPTFYWVGVGSGQIARFAAQTQACFETFRVWVGSGCMDRAIFGLFKGSGTFFGGKTTTQSSNCLPEPNPISFQVGLGWVRVR